MEITSAVFRRTLRRRNFRQAINWHRVQTLTRCIFCQRCSLLPYPSQPTHRRSLQTSTKPRNNASPKPPNAPVTTGKPGPVTPEAIAPLKREDGTKEVRMLMRPIGVVNPPKPGENTGADPRNFNQKKADLVDWDKHLQRRKELTAEMSKSYFQDFKDMNYEKGKIFIAPPKLFKSTKALYFPNLQGRTLASPDFVNTTCLLEGRVSLVSFFTSAWANEQVKTFTSALDGQNIPNYISKPDDLISILEGDRQPLEGIWQQVQLNVEENPLRAWVLRMSMGGIRRKIGEENHVRYIHVKNGLNDDLRSSLGILNKRVGYVYLVDAYCRIRWAGSGNASSEEKASLVSCLQKLVAEEEKRRAEVSLAGKKQKVKPKVGDEDEL